MNDDILHSWKDISVYLQRDARTCSRWEKDLGMPVHRIDENSSHSKVFAYKSEIDQWLKRKTGGHDRRRRAEILSRLFIKATLTIALTTAFLSMYQVVNSPETLMDSKTVLAVQPFGNLDISRAGEYFSAGITRELMFFLSRLNKFRVVPWFVQADKSGNGFESGKASAAMPGEYILSGEAGQFGGNVIIAVWLRRRSDHEIVMTREYRGNKTNLPLLHADICEHICQALKIGLKIDRMKLLDLMEPHKDSTIPSLLKGRYILEKLENEADPRVLYTEGQYYRQQSTRESNELALLLFKKAVELDSSFAPAYIGMATCCMNYVNFNWDFNMHWLDDAENLLEKGQRFQPDMKEYFSALSKLQLIRDISCGEERLENAFEAARGGLSLYPYDFDLNSIMGYCHYARFGRSGNERDFSYALHYKEKAFVLDQLNLKNLPYIEILMLDRKFSRALEICRQLVAIDKSSEARFRLGELYYYSGALDECEEIFLGFEEPLKFKTRAQSYLGMTAARRGDFKRANNIAGHLTHFSTETFWSRLQLASIHCGIKQNEAAFENIRSLIDKKNTRKMIHVIVKYIDLDPNFVFQKAEIIRILKGDEHGGQS